MNQDVYDVCYESLPEKELSAENLMTGIFGSFLDQGIIQLRAVSTDLRRAYNDANPFIIKIARKYNLIPKKEVSPRLNADGDFGFNRGIQAAIQRGLACYDQSNTVLHLRPEGMLETLNFWSNLPESKDMYNDITQQILDTYHQAIRR